MHTDTIWCHHIYFLIFNNHVVVNNSNVVCWLCRQRLLFFIIILHETCAATDIQTIFFWSLITQNYCKFGVSIKQTFMNVSKSC